MKEKRDFCEEEEAITKFIVDGGIKKGKYIEPVKFMQIPVRFLRPS